jgi:hypothetical protein
MKEFADEIRDRISGVSEGGQTKEFLGLISLLRRLTNFRSTIIGYEKEGKLTKEEAQELEIFRADNYNAVIEKLPSD